MSMITTTCPHCRASEIALKVVGFDWTRFDNVVNAYTTCPRCMRPICHELWPSPNARCTKEWFGSSSARVETLEVLSGSGWTIKQTFPAADAAEAPASTPAEVARIFIQARNTHQRQELDAAAMLYRKTLETSVKVLDPQGKGMLEKRIIALTANDLIPEAVAKWAHEIRGIGNDAAHDADEPTKDEVDAAAEFVEAFLTYAFTMPARINNRLTKPEEPLVEA